MKKQTVTESRYLRDSFLSSYLLSDIIFSQYMNKEEQRKIFDEYARLYCIHDKDWLNDVWDIAASDLFSLANTLSDYNRLVRLNMQYPNCISELEAYVLGQKAYAARTKEEIFSLGSPATLTAAENSIRRKAKGGDVDCMALVAFMEYNGITSAPNKSAALRGIQKAASWNNLFALLMGIRYASDMPFYAAKLCAILDTPSRAEAWQHLCSELKISEKIQPDGIAAALEKAFCKSVFSAIKLQPEVLKLMRSTVIRDSDKCKLIKAEQGKGPFFTELPLGINKEGGLQPKTEVFHGNTEERSEEITKITANLSMLDVRQSSLYKPLLLVCENKMVFDTYKEKLERCFEGHSKAHISVSHGTKLNFSESFDNSLVAAMDRTEDKNAVIFIENCENLNDDDALSLSRLLSGQKRKHFPVLRHPAIELDLSGATLILLSSSLPSREILKVCDVVMANDLSKEEFRILLLDELQEQKTLFGLSSIRIEDDAVDHLFDYSAESVTELISKTICALRPSTTDVVLTVSALEETTRSHHASYENNSFWRDTVK